MSTQTVLLDGLGFPESTRWHDGRVWLCNWGPGEVLAVSPAGEPEVIARLEGAGMPLSIDWLPDGTLLLVEGRARRLLRRAEDGRLQLAADLTSFGEAPFNEIVVDRAGNAYVNGGPGCVALVRPDGATAKVAEGFQWPNGMALIDDERTLVVADSQLKQLIAFSVNADGGLAERRVWAELEHAPDGICADSDGAIWVASVPGEHCVRVREGGEVLDVVSVDRGCFACMLGGEDGRTLFIATATWRGMEVAMRDGPGSSGQLIAAPGQPARHAGRP